MIVANLYPIKNTNGLFYYGVDYLHENPGLIRKVLVRPALAAAARRFFPDCEIVSCNAGTLLREAFRAALRRDVLYTPTPHPLPFIGRQWIVVHDAYPFTIGAAGRIKKLLLRISLSLSRCRVAYINESETLKFIQALGVSQRRLIFAPNKIATESPQAFARRRHAAGEPLRVGLVGTDSRKKNYADLLAAVKAAPARDQLEFRVYGHRTPYYEALVHDHPEANLELFESDSHALADFLAGIDVLVSVADQEGFGRPIAAALAAGIPCFLLAKPVFKEFFSDACLFGTVRELVHSLLAGAAEGLPRSGPYTPPVRIVEAFARSANELKREASGMPRGPASQAVPPISNRHQAPSMPPLLTLSIVSHGQQHLIRSLLDDLANLEFQDFEVVLTINLPEDESAYRGRRYPVRLIRNDSAKGFGANHNAAFAQSRGRFFAVVNPDIRIQALDVPALLAPLEDARVAAVAPVILSGDGRIEDSVRRFPTFARLARRVLLRRREPDYQWGDAPIAVDWTAGMFVVLRPEAFEAVRGFDDRRFFMYFEDVDICARLWKQGWSVILQPRVSVIHDAQRASHRSMKHLRWHLTSCLRYLTGL